MQNTGIPYENNCLRNAGIIYLNRVCYQLISLPRRNSSCSALNETHINIHLTLPKLVYSYALRYIDKDRRTGNIGC